ncbi:MAG TPA: FHA domain-containing protein [Candidatus Methylomirabilis sp.]|nr:FHA domain-containing protein [Candidatus Methylomirabilis sp.]
MGVVLEIRGGAMAGKVIAVTTGQSVTLGRANGRADVAFPQDTFMSGVHFAIECGTSGCRVVDRKSSNGTFLNGAKIQDALLANGDEIKAGQTVFAVKILSDEKLAGLGSPQGAAEPAPAAAPPDSAAGSYALAQAASPKLSEVPASAPRRTLQQVPQSAPAAPGMKSDLPPQLPKKEPAGPVVPLSQPPAAAMSARAAAKAEERPAGPSAGGQPGAAQAGEFAVSIMGWSFPAVPAKWQVQEGLGLQSEEGDFPSSVALAQEALGGITLPQFIEFQINMLKGYLREARIEPVVPPRVGGAEETTAVDVRHKTKDGKELIYRRIYVRSGSAVGVMTVTTLASEFPHVLESLQPLLNGAAFQATVQRS